MSKIADSGNGGITHETVARSFFFTLESPMISIRRSPISTASTNPEIIPAYLPMKEVSLKDAGEI